MATEIPIHDGIAGLAGRYDGWIVDLWGVLHNGEAPYPGAVDALQRLRGEGKRVCLLSNAPRRVGPIIERLTEIGIPRDAYDDLCSSGEATHEALRDRPDPFHRALGRRFLFIGGDRDINVYEGLDLERVDDPGAADFVLNTGIDDFAETLEDHEPVLAAAAARRLPMVCANPDLVVVVGEQLAICAGTLARRYEELAEVEVVYHGKPHAPVYHRVLERLGITDAARLVAVGDSFRTDIAGAGALGIDGVLVAGGIHAEELGFREGGGSGVGREAAIDAAALARLARESGCRPVAALPRLAW